MAGGWREDVRLGQEGLLTAFESPHRSRVTTSRLLSVWGPSCRGETPPLLVPVTISPRSIGLAQSRPASAFAAMTSGATGSGAVDLTYGRVRRILAREPVPLRVV